jgi:hypothetical protein
MPCHRAGNAALTPQRAQHVSTVGRVDTLEKGEGMAARVQATNRALQLPSQYLWDSARNAFFNPRVNLLEHQ